MNEEPFPRSSELGYPAAQTAAHMTTSSAMELLRSIRSPRRLRSSQLIARVFDDFRPFPTPDRALIAGRARLGRHDALVLAQEKPTSASASAAASVNYGMMRASGYWYVVQRLEQAASERTPVVTFIDTPGADPSKGGTECLIAWAISACLTAFIKHPARTVSFIHGEGGSGGALALQATDYRMMASDALYSVISPEGCSAILHRDRQHIGPAMDLLRPTASTALSVGAIDEIIDWSGQIALNDHSAAARVLRERLLQALDVPSEETLPFEERRRVRALLACGARISRGQTRELTRLPLAPPRPASVAGLPQRFQPVNADNAVVPSFQTYFSEPVDERTGAELFCCPVELGGCGTISPLEALRDHHWACPMCGRGERLTSEQWVELLADAGSFEELYRGLTLRDLVHGGYDDAEYRTRCEQVTAQTGLFEALRVGIGELGGISCAIAVSDFHFLGGTLSAACGEKIRLICELAVRERLPLVSLTCSGGARMQEGMLALVQMAKANAAIACLRERGLPHISVLLDPCTGGALASYATAADVVLAEPRALVAFAGPRVSRLMGLPVDETSLSSNYIARIGGIDEVVERRHLRSRIAALLSGDSMPAGRDPGRRAVSTELDGWLHGLTEATMAMLGEPLEPGSTSSCDSAVATASCVRRLADFALLSVPAMLEGALAAEDARIRANAVEALGRFPKRDFAHLTSALGDSHRRVRTNAAVAILQVDPDSAQALSVVRLLCESPDSEDRRAGLFALTRVAIPSMREVVDSLAVHPDAYVRIAAGAALFTAGDAAAAQRTLRGAATEIGRFGLLRARRLLPFMPEDVRPTARTCLDDLANQLLAGEA